MKPVSPRAVLSIVSAGILIGAAATHAQIAKGANKYLGNITTNGQVRSGYLTYWNQITPENESKWQSVEGTRNQMNWAGVDRVRDFARTNNIPWKFHTLVWGSQYPSWMDGLSQADQLKEITEWFDAVKARYPDLEEIDVVNEAMPGHAPAPWKNALGGDGASGYEWIFKAFRMARERWPNATLIYNDFNNIEYTNDINWTYNMVTSALKNNVPIDAIGAQAHDAYKINTNTVKAAVDKLASTGLPIFISEYDIGESDDAKQRSIMESQFTMFWNHPKVAGITYWGYIVGNTWRTGTGLMSSSNVERPALTWLKNYVPTNKNPPKPVVGPTTGVESRADRSQSVAGTRLEIAPGMRGVQAVFERDGQTIRTDITGRR